MKNVNYQITKGLKDTFTSNLFMRQDGVLYFVQTLTTILAHLMGPSNGYCSVKSPKITL